MDLLLLKKEKKKKFDRLKNSRIIGRKVQQYMKILHLLLLRPPNL
jgi:hypothetical protein